MKKIIGVLTAFAPSLVFAQAITDVNTLTYKATNIFNTAIVILLGFAVLYIIFNVVRYLIMNKEGDEKKSAAGKAIFWGIVGLFIILSIWGLVKILTNTFRTDTTAPVNQFPQVQYPPQVP